MKYVVEKIVREYMANQFNGQISPKFDVYEVWHCYILGNEKWLVATNLNDGMYFEVTYSNDKCEYYLDAYKKCENVVISSEYFYEA